MKFKYYSKEWCEEAQRRLSSDPAHLAAAKNLTGTFGFRLYDCPDGTDRIAYWEFDKGKCLNISWEAKPAPAKEIRDLPFDRLKTIVRTSAPYEMLLALNNGEISVLKCLTNPKYKIEGPKTEAMRYMKGLNSWNKVCLSIPLEE